MAKKTTKQAEGKWKISWRNFFIAASVSLNIAFVVLIVAMATTNALDGMFMYEGLKRYCDPVNDSRFGGQPAENQALRDFTCAKGAAKQDFEKAFNNYLQTN